MTARTDITTTLDASDPNGVFQDQTLGGAGDFTLNGALVSGGVATTGDGLLHLLSFESSANLSTVTFTITYKQYPGAADSTATIAGPNANTVTTTEFMYSISNIAADGAVGTNVECGFADECTTIPHKIDILGAAQTTFALYVASGTFNADVEFAFDPPSADFNSMGWMDDSTFAAKTASANTYIDSPATYARLHFNSYSATPTINWHVIATPK